jgi:lincosamide nucleotidyltransferase A/C/D/E
MDAERVLDLLSHLESREISVWLDGGWAVDALLGEQTRLHDDLDLVSRVEDSARIESALGDRGYVLAGGGLPHSFELVDAEGHQVDAHPVLFRGDGDGVYPMVDGGESVFPAAGFGGAAASSAGAFPASLPRS